MRVEELRHHYRADRSRLGLTFTRRLVLVAALVVVGPLLGSVLGADASGGEDRTCFAADQWGPAPDRARPCVEVKRVWEDGSFRAVVADASGRHAATVNIGNPRD